MASDEKKLEGILDKHQKYLDAIHDGIVEGVKEGLKKGAAKGSRRAAWDTLKKECLPQGFMNVSASDIENIVRHLSELLKNVDGDITEVTNKIIERNVKQYRDRLVVDIIKKFRGEKPELALALELITKRENKVGDLIGERLPDNPISSGIAKGVKTALKIGIDRSIQGFRNKLKDEFGGVESPKGESQETVTTQRIGQIKADSKKIIRDVVAKVVEEIIYKLVKMILMRVIARLKEELREKLIHKLEHKLGDITKQKLEQVFEKSTERLVEEIGKDCVNDTSFIENIDRTFGGSAKEHLKSLVPKFPIVLVATIVALILIILIPVLLIDCGNQPPIAIITSPIDIDGLTASFSSNDSYDTDGEIMSYRWEFGDGFTSIEPNIIYTYEEAGNYTVVLTATDDKGATDKDTKYVYVETLPPYNEPPEVMATFPPDGSSLASGVSFLGPIAKALDSSLYLAGESEGIDYLYKSTNFGETWKRLIGLPDIKGETIVNIGERIVDVVPSSEYQSTVYITDGINILKTTDGGTTWVPLSNLFTSNVGADGSITSIDVGYVGTTPYIFAATSTLGSGGGGVYVCAEAVFGMPWSDMGIDLDRETPWLGVDVYDIKLDSNFAATQMVMAVATKISDDTSTYVTMKYPGQQWGAPGSGYSTDDVELRLNSTTPVTSPFKADIWLPDNFDSSPPWGSSTQYFVSVASFNAAEGDVFKVIHDWTLVPEAAPFFHAVDLDVAGISTGINITDLKGVGEIDTLILLAGGDDGSGKPRILLSTDGMGNVWANCTTPPTGGIWSDIAGVSLVLADDFATSGKAVAVTTGENSGVARTVDWGGIWNTVPLIDAEITIEFSQPMDKEVTSQALTIPGKIYRIDYEIIWDETSTSMTIKPIVIWQPYWDYEVIITDQARSEDGINLEEDYTFHFKT